MPEVQIAAYVSGTPGDFPEGSIHVQRVNNERYIDLTFDGHEFTLYPTAEETAALLAALETLR